MVAEEVDASIDCYATIVAIRGPNINEVKHIGNTLMMVFDISSNGIQIGTFVLPYHPNCEIGHAYRMKITLTKIEREEYLAGHGIREIDNKMKEFIV